MRACCTLLLFPVLLSRNGEADGSGADGRVPGGACCLAAPALAQKSNPVTFETTACPERITAGERVECGVLSVPEKRDAVSDRMVKLPVTIFRSRSATPGGRSDRVPCGRAGTVQSGARSGASDPLLEERDRIWLEPRGAVLHAEAGVPGVRRCEDGDLHRAHRAGGAGKLAGGGARSCRTRLIAEGID